MRWTLLALWVACAPSPTAEAPEVEAPTVSVRAGYVAHVARYEGPVIVRTGDHVNVRGDDPVWNLLVLARTDDEVTLAVRPRDLPVLASASVLSLELTDPHALPGPEVWGPEPDDDLVPAAARRTNAPRRPPSR
ncbi:MAG: hypothetical protein H6721_26155 [Sandaracinus sp.]|nr:hypothetical protein [Sandaracinus sp.]MCB9622590.1 hypothetical protein [Sandaracinus sp.]MCB9635618.1 hypothetical protein [Sandaracinus sp.]